MLIIRFKCNFSIFLILGICSSSISNTISDFLLNCCSTLWWYFFHTCLLCWWHFIEIRRNVLYFEIFRKSYRIPEFLIKYVSLSLRRKSFRFIRWFETTVLLLAVRLLLIWSRYQHFFSILIFFIVSSFCTYLDLISLRLNLVSLCVRTIISIIFFFIFLAIAIIIFFIFLIVLLLQISSFYFLLFFEILHIIILLTTTTIILFTLH